MFTGIVESIGIIVSIKKHGSNKVFTLSSDLVPELKIDQSLSHNGVCLTVEMLDTSNGLYQVTAIDETLGKTTLSRWKTGDKINLERSLTLEQRLDGHLVQGHVDGIIECSRKKDKAGSVFFTFDLPGYASHLVIPQGSITLDGISLTVASLTVSDFSVAIIPFTQEHTSAGSWTPGQTVNVEYDVFGKYLNRYRQLFENYSVSEIMK